MSKETKTAAFGTLERSLDSRLRITISSEFEELFHKDPPILCYWTDYSLALMPESVFNDFLQQMMAGRKDVKLQSFRNFFLANANKLTIDSNHRITLRRQDVEFLRKSISSEDKEESKSEKDFDWRQELILSGQFDYIVIQASEGAKKTLSPELMPEYGEYMDESYISMQMSRLENTNDSDKD